MTVANVGASADNVFTTSVANAASLSGHVLVSCRAGPPGPPSGGPLPGACSGWAQRSGGRRGPSQPLLLAPARLGPRGGGRCLRTPRPACCLLPVPLQVPLARGVPVVPQPSHAPCARGPPTPSCSARRPRPQSLLWPFTAKAFRDLGAQPVSRVRAGVAVPRKWTVPGALAGLLRFPSASMAQLGHKAPDGKVLVFRTATNKTPVNHRAAGGGGRAARVSVRGSSVRGTAGLVASCRSLLPGSRFRPVSLSRRTGGQGRGVRVPPASEAGALRLVQAETPHPSGGLLGSAFASGGAASQACGRRPACVRSGPLSATGSSRSTPE